MMIYVGGITVQKTCKNAVSYAYDVLTQFRSFAHFVLHLCLEDALAAFS